MGPPKGELVEIGGRCWGAHPSYLILLYKGLIGLVGFTNMAKTHELGLESQYRVSTGH
jgi:hypothetical protein